MSRSAKSNTKRNFLGHNFGIVYRFEVVRTLKKKSFWLSILAFPLMFAAIFAIVYFSGKAGSSAEQDLANDKFTYAITDESGVVNPALARQMGAKIVDASGKGAIIDQVKDNQLDAYFYYPQDLTTGKIEIFAKDAGLFDSSKYSTVAKMLLTNSVQSDINANAKVVLSGQVGSTATYYKDGEVYNQLGDMIMPGVFLVLFYLIICIFGSQMLTATVEEKENRITEMLLTTIKSRTLIIGKIFAFMTLILIQALVLIGFVLVGYFITKQFIELPNFDFSIITFDPVRIGIAAVLFIISTLMFSGLMVAIGAAAPTAKEANQFMTVPILLLFAPLYVTGVVLSTPEAPVVQAMIFFPFTAPVLLMLMNALGTLPIGTAIISICIMTVTTIAIFIIASHLFQRGAIEYDKRIKLFALKTRPKAVK